jgi:hypothetical protein
MGGSGCVRSRRETSRQRWSPTMAKSVQPLRNQWTRHFSHNNLECPLIPTITKAASFG